MFDPLHWLAKTPAVFLVKAHQNLVGEFAPVARRRQLMKPVAAPTFVGMSFRADRMKLSAMI